MSNVRRLSKNLPALSLSKRWSKGKKRGYQGLKSLRRLEEKLTKRIKTTRAKKRKYLSLANFSMPCLSDEGEKG